MQPPNPPDMGNTPRLHESGLVERFQLGEGIVWCLTPTAINQVLDAEAALQKLVHDIVSTKDASRRCRAGVSLIYDLSLQGDIDGIWIAIDHARQAIEECDLNGRGESGRPVGLTSDPEEDGVAQAVAAIVFHPHISLRMTLLAALVRHVRADTGFHDVPAIARFLEGLA